MQPLARRVFEAVAKAHCQPRKPDDRFSEDWFNALLAAVDPDKLALTAADVQALSAHRYRLDNDLATPTAPVLDALFDLLSRRLAETETLLTALRAGPVSLQAPLNRPGPYADRAASDAERLQRLRAAARIDLWEQLAHRFVEGTVPAGEAALTQARTHEPKLRARLSATRLAFNCWQGVTGVAARRRALEALYLGTLTACFDPHTAWFSLDDQEAFVNAVSGLATGIGIQLEESAFDQLRIVRLVPGGPAWRSGQVAVGDAVVAVQDGDTWVRADETDADDFLEKLSRRAETALTLRLRKGDGRETVVSLQAETLRDDESLVQGFVLAGGPRPVGYVRLPDFYSNEAADRHASCADDVARTLVKLQRDGIRGLILDLRYNGGGVMDEALQLAGLFIDQGPLALARTKPGERLVLKDPNRGTVYDGPLVVMTNAHSASASEFVAAALQDHRRAVLVGSRTHGKGSMQTLFPLETGQTPPQNVLKVTMGTFYRPSGRPVQGRGVQPDVPLPGLGETEALFEEAQPFALPADSLAGASFVPRPAPPLAALRERSRERLQTSGFGDGVTALNRALREEAEGPTAYAGFAAFLQKRARQVQTARALLEAEAGASPFRCRRPSFDGTASDESLPLWTAILETDPYLREAYRVIADWRSLTNDN